MIYKSVLITGGAGFVGSNLAIDLKNCYPEIRVVAFDNLKRRGSELNISRLKAKDIEFVHGDIRCSEDITFCGAFDLLIDCSAEPSVHAGMQDAPKSIVNTNLVGTLNIAEAARINNAAFLFLSTSRVYPIEMLNSLDWEETRSRFMWRGNDNRVGLDSHGVSEDFPLTGARSFYGATKLASELILREYAFAYGLPVLINRCGIIAGPWQMGKVDQGVVTLWVVSHLFRRRLRYTGFGGTGKQVRDMLHVSDFSKLILKQLDRPDVWDGRVYNVGGGYDVSSSLLELTEICAAATGNKVKIDASKETSAIDLRIYITDARKAQNDFSWKPQKSVDQIVVDIISWAQSHRSELKSVLLR
jgi:CDP-paratose 2-epimerase